MAALRTIVFFTVWVVGTLICGTLCMPLLFSQRGVWAFNSAWVMFTLWWLRITCGVRSELRGQPSGQLIACKHQSAWDTIMMMHTFRNPVFVLKRELYWIPIFGWFLWRSGQIAIDRTNSRGAYEQIARQAPKLLAQGRAIIMFPEGTRVRVGDRKPFRSGIARVSVMLNLPVVPAALNAGLFWPKHTVIKTPGTAVLEFLPPLPVCGKDITKWLKGVEEAILGCTEALVREGLAARAE